MTTITFDVECVGCEDEATIAEIAATIKPPGNLKKAETIAKWEAEDKPGVVAEAIKKTSFDGALGRIVCIGWAVDYEEPETCWDYTEDGIISTFFDAVRDAAEVHRTKGAHATIVFVGHNIIGFDFRFLWQRAVVLGIKPPSIIPFMAKPWDVSIADTMMMWNPDRDRRISLDRLCKALDVPTPKDGMDGSMVWDYVRAGRLEEIATYCRGDVEATRACYRRMMFAEPDFLANAA